MDLSVFASLSPTQIMTLLHNKYALRFRNYIARILEMEYYSLDDPFTHCNERQYIPGVFYVHRTGKEESSSYKGGTFKGMDVVLDGCALLIRSVSIALLSKDDTGKIIMTPEDSIIEGPCNVVDAICARTQWDLKTLESSIKMIPLSWEEKPAMLSARVGLTLKRAPDDQLEQWASSLIAPLRSCLFIPTKGREMFFVVDLERTDVITRSRDKYRLEYQQGKGETLSRNMTPLQIAGCLSNK